MSTSGGGAPPSQGGGLLLDAGDLPSLRKNLSTLEDFFQVLEYAMEKLGAEPRHGMSTATEIGLRALPKSYEATKEAPFDWSRFAADEVKAKRDEWSSAAARERERSRTDRYKDDRYSSYKRDNYKDSGKDKK